MPATLPNTSGFCSPFPHNTQVPPVTPLVSHHHHSQRREVRSTDQIEKWGSEKRSNREVHVKCQSYNECQQDARAVSWLDEKLPQGWVNSWVIENQTSDETIIPWRIIVTDGPMTIDHQYTIPSGYTPGYLGHRSEVRKLTGSSEVDRKFGTFVFNFPELFSGILLLIFRNFFPELFFI